MNSPASSPRRTPQQDRSRVTVAAILEASLQVLLRSGLARLTTTAVAERAGVSVGTLYQYFPNKRALLLAVLRAHLTGVTDAVVAAARRSMGQSRRTVVAAVVRAFVEAKFADVRSARALYAIAAELGGPAVVRASAGRAREAIEAALAAAPESIAFGEAGRRSATPDGPRSDDGDELVLVSGMLVAMMIGPVQEALESGGPAHSPERLCRELTLALTAYVEQRS